MKRGYAISTMSSGWLKSGSYLSLSVIKPVSICLSSNMSVFEIVNHVDSNSMEMRVNMGSTYF